MNMHAFAERKVLQQHSGHLKPHRNTTLFPHNSTAWRNGMIQLLKREVKVLRVLASGHKVFPI